MESIISPFTLSVDWLAFTVPHAFVYEVMDAVHEENEAHQEAGDRELFEVLMAARRTPSVQDAADLVRKHFLVLLR